MSVAGRARRRRHAALVLTLLPFLLQGRIGLVVFLNGAAQHVSEEWRLPGHKYVKAWDVACNVALCAFVNWHTAWQPQTAVLSALAFCAWQANNAVCAGESMELHACGVQASLLVCLSRFLATGAGRRP